MPLEYEEDSRESRNRHDEGVTHHVEHKKEVDRNTRTDHEKNEEASQDSFSHYLRLADGRTVRFNVGDKPNDPFPTTFGEDKVRVVEVHSA